MATQLELMERGSVLANTYSSDVLKDKLKDAIAIGDHEERLAIQFALKQLEGTTDGYAYTVEQTHKMNTKLPIQLEN